jgi:hypothetical protein
MTLKIPLKFDVKYQKTINYCFYTNKEIGRILCIGRIPVLLADHWRQWLMEAITWRLVTTICSKASLRVIPTPWAMARLVGKEHPQKIRRPLALKAVAGTLHAQTKAVDRRFLDSVVVAKTNRMTLNSSRSDD